MVYVEYLAYPYKFFSHPYAILLIIPILILLKIVLRNTFVKLKNEKLDPEWAKRRQQLRKIVYLTRGLMFLLLLLAIASPFVERETLIDGDPFLRLIIDNSSSFSAFDQEVGSRLREELGRNIRVETRYVGSDEKSPLGDAVLSSMQANGHILLVSDGHNNFGADLGDVALYASRLNTTINSIDLDPIKNDVRVSIEGPQKTFEEKEETFVVHVDQIGITQTYHIKVTVDDHLVLDTDSDAPFHTITRQFPSGYHRLEATITAPDDFFPQNNRFYKTVKVVAKPPVLLVSKADTPLRKLTDQIYEVTPASSIPPDLSKYYAIFLNDMSKDDISDADSDRLFDYISDGNGLFVAGGMNSYEHGAYKDSRLESLLPVFVGSAGREEGDVNVVVIIDISGSTGSKIGPDGAIVVDVMKAQGISIINDLKPINNVGVIAFNTQGFVVEPLGPLFQKTGLVEKIAKLKNNGGTKISAGLFTAIQMLKPMSGSKNVILISDGVTTLLTEAQDTARLAAKTGIKVYTVAVGTRRNEFTMASLAQLGGGIFFVADQSSRLRLLFGDPEDVSKDYYGVVVLDQHHPISRNAKEVRAIITGHNQVVPKSTASLIATTDTGDPLIAAWRFGLGRIVAYGTDDGRAWAGEMLTRNNSPLIVGALTWTTGDPERKAAQFVDIADTHLNEPTTMFVKSQAPPSAEGLIFFKMGEDLYKSTITPTAEGFNQVIDAMFAVNYKQEFSEVGMADELEDEVLATGGSIYKPDEVDRIIEEVKTKSKRSIVKKVYIRWPLILAVIILFLVDILIRKVWTYEKGK